MSVRLSLPLARQHQHADDRAHLSVVWVYAIMAALAASSVYTALRSIAWPMFRDAPIMHYIGWEILGGAAPYKDVFDMNMPGTYLIHMFIIKVLGPGVVAWHAFNILWAVLTAALIAAFCAPYGRWAVAVTTLLFACHYFGGNQTHVGQRDFLLGPFLVLAAYAWARYLETEHRSRYLLLAGVAIGAAVTVKPLAAILLVFIAVSHVVKTRHRRGALVAGGVAMVVGGSMVPGAVLAWLASTGSIAAMWQIMTGYLPLYAHLGGEMSIPMPVSIGSRALILAPAVPFASSLARARVSDPYRRYSVLMACVGYGVLHFLLQHKGWYYHLFPVNLFLLMLTGMVLGDVMRDPVRRTRTVAVVMFAIIALPLAGRCVLEGRVPESLKASRPLVAHLVHDLSSYSLSESDRVQVMDGTRGGIQALYLLKVRLATPFVYDMYFYHDMDTALVQGLRRDLIEDMNHNRPRLIVFFRDTWVQPKDFSKLDSFPELARFLDTYYRKDRTFQDYTIYAAK